MKWGYFGDAVENGEGGGGRTDYRMNQMLGAAFLFVSSFLFYHCFTRRKIMLKITLRKFAKFSIK